MGCAAQSLDSDTGITIAIRLADEGVPVRAIARAIKVSSEILREKLSQALTDGRLLDLPRDDWPPGFPRDQRALQLSRLVIEDRDQLLVAMQQVFRLTPTEINLLLVLMQHPLLLKERVDNMNVETIDVHIHRIRKRLAVFGIEIQTRWGHGYEFSVENRRKIMDLVLRKPKRA
jgi:DNA-binding response OmpR family regulator